MTTTAKKVCVFLADTLFKRGVRRVVVSPGSRNTPLIVAFSRHPGLKVFSVVDERSAAFIGLGMARASARPVAVCCTSGTAGLNFGPAVAEAYYSSVPLIVITADRPAGLVARRAPQTIVQPGIYAGFIKSCVDIACEDGSDAFIRDAVSRMDSAVAMAAEGVRGPVHINVQLAAPLGQLAEFEPCDLDVVADAPYAVPSEFDKSKYAGRTFIFVGAGANVSKNILRQASELPGVVVFAECYTGFAQTGDSIISNVGPALAAGLQRSGAPRPQRVIKVGNSLLSKTYYDRFDSEAICVNDDASLAALLPYGYAGGAYFKTYWSECSRKAYSDALRLAANAPWSQLKATDAVVSQCACCNVQISNGMSIRYAQIFDWRRAESVGCNRGVSGIDGSVSTAIGFAAVSERPTVLITGDMSFQYDMGALATNFIPDDFVIIVMNNRGGGIFRYIDTTRHLDELEPLISGPVNLPVEGLARAFGFGYRRADSVTRLLEALNDARASKMIIEVVTDTVTDCKVLNNYYNTI